MPEWYEGLDADGLTAATAKGWNKPGGDVVGDIFKAYTAAQSFIGSDPNLVVKLPKDATDPSYAGLYDRVVGMSLPKSPAEYTFDGVAYKDGTALDAEDAAFVRDFAAKHKLPLATARAFATDLVGRADAMIEAQATGGAAAKAANDGALRTSWGAEYDANAAATATVVDGLKALGISLNFDGADPAAHVGQMNGLLKLGQQLKESPILRGGENMLTPTAMTPEAAQARFDELKMNPEWSKKAWGQPGSPEATEFHNLQAYMSGITPEEYATFKNGGRINRR